MRVSTHPLLRQVPLLMLTAAMAGGQRHTLRLESSEGSLAFLRQQLYDKLTNHF
jgi:hypothetical protein